MNFIGGIIGLVVGTALGASLGAFVLQFSTNIIAGFKPTYGAAYFAHFVGGLATNVLGFVVMSIVVGTGNEMSLVGYGIVTIIEFALYSWLLGFTLECPYGGAIGFKMASLIFLMHSVLVLAILFAGAVLFGLIIK